MIESVHDESLVQVQIARDFRAISLLTEWGMKNIVLPQTDRQFIKFERDHTADYPFILVFKFEDMFAILESNTADIWYNEQEFAAHIRKELKHDRYRKP